MADLLGSRALVTGASSGIGTEIAFDLARRGANLILTARREERLQEVAQVIRDSWGRGMLPFGSLIR